MSDADQNQPPEAEPPESEVDTDAHANGSSAASDDEPLPGVPEAAPDDEPDSQPEAAAESDPESRVDLTPPVPLKPWMRTVVRVFAAILPVLLAGGAVAVHWKLNVPDHIEHSPRDQGESKDAKGAKARAAREKFQPRDQARLDREWKKWKDEKIDGEPVRGPWARKFQTVISKAVVVARREGFAKAPEEPRVIVTGTECHTVRCRFVLRSPFEHELTMIDGALQRLVDHNGTIWRTYESHPIPPPNDAPEGQHHVEVIVAFASDEVDSRGFTMGEAVPGTAEPARTPPPTPASPTEPGAADEPDDAGAPDDALGQPDEPEEEERGGGDDDD